MAKIENNLTVSSLTVLYDEPFWVGIFERRHAGRYEACRTVFGAEPSDGEIYEFFIKNQSHLVFSPPIKERQTEPRKINPKRMQREVKKAVSESGVGTKAQMAIKLIQEQNKVSRRIVSKEEREREKQRQLEIHINKKKEKHRGH